MAASSGPAAACTRGPCASPATVAYLPGGGGGAPAAVANFGLMLADAAGGSWQYVCDDVYGTPRPELVRSDGRGRVFAGGTAGLLWSADGCAWSAAAGAVAGQEVLDLAFDPPQGRVWALVGEPRVLARSDGGAPFVSVHAFAAGEAYTRLLVAPSDPGRLYLAGEGPSPGSTVLAVSADGGATWTARDLSGGVTPPLSNLLTPLAVAPDDPRVVLFSLVDAYGDEIWRSDDGGQSVQRVLKGGPRDAMTGLAFGADARTVYAAAQVIPVIDQEPPGHLYVSRDGGRTWGAPIASARSGPSYRCLQAAGRKLYACGLGEPAGEPFLVGVSEDEGITWRPVLRLQDLAGARSCVRATCAATEAWLCDRYGRCPAGSTPEPPTPADAGARPDAAGVSGASAGGCGCRMGGGGRGGAAGVFVVMAFVLGRRRRRRSWSCASACSSSSSCSCEVRG